MNYWNKIPLFRLLLPFICGSLSAFYCEGLTKLLIFLLPIAMGIFILTFFLKEFYSDYNNRIFLGYLIHVILFLTGAFITASKQQALFNNLHGNKEKAYYLCKVLEPLSEKEKTYKSTVELTAEKSGTKWKKTKGKLLVYFKKDQMARWPQSGDGLLLHTRLQTIEGPRNPHEYDYKKQMQLKGIYFRSFLDKNDWRTVTIDKSFSLKKYAFHFRSIIFAQFKKYLPLKNEYAVAEALLVGNTEDLDPELSQAYATAGVVHILSVSGLHIGLVYMVFNSLLFFMNQRKALKITKFLILILFLWAYALVSGLSPSVLRAAMMLSLVLVGKALNRNTNTYNTLAASAFVLLIFAPELILDLGFQLSYLAVLGILLLHPIIYKQWKTQYYIPDKIWQMTSVSLAAQAFTLPLILFHFHQMPNYFVLANIIAIPLATLILFSGIALVMAVQWHWLCDLIGSLMHYQLKVLNITVQEIETWPWALSQNISLNIWDTLYLYAAIICFLLFYFHRNILHLLTGLCFLLFFQSSQTFVAIAASHQKRIIVYNITKCQAIDLIDGNKAYLFADSATICNKRRMAFYIDGSRMALHIKVRQAVLLTKENVIDKRKHWLAAKNCILFYNTRIYLANAESRNIRPPASKKICVDFIILSQSYKGTIAALLKTCNSPLIILDASFNTNNSSKREAECRQSKIATHSISRQGAFQKDIF